MKVYNLHFKLLMFKQVSSYLKLLVKHIWISTAKVYRRASIPNKLDNNLSLLVNFEHCIYIVGRNSQSLWFETLLHHFYDINFLSRLEIVIVEIQEPENLIASQVLTETMCCLLTFAKLTGSSQKILPVTLSECQIVWIQIRTDVLLGLIWVQTVCKGYSRSLC